MRSAARYAAGAAVAYLSIAQAKAAVTTTQELAATSANLSRNLGLSTKQASRWASVAKTRDISTRQLSTSFSTLTQRITDAKAGSEESIKAFKALGISQADLKRDGGDFNRQLLTVSDALESVKGGAERQAAATDLLGRGYQNLIPIMGQGSDKLREQLALGDKYGATMGKDAVEAQQKLAAQVRESERAMQGMQVQFTTMLTPALKKVNEQFQRLGHIMANDKLTDTEKFEKVGKIMGKWADKALDAFVAVLPKMVEAAGKAAPKIAGAFVKGFLNSDLLGKLAIGTILFSKYGGITSAGSAIGKKFGVPFGKAFGPVAIALFGVALLDWLIKNREKIINVAQGSTPYTSHLMDTMGVGPKRAEAIQTAQKNSPGLSAEAANAQIKANNAIEKEAKRHQETLNRIDREGFEWREDRTRQAVEVALNTYDRAHARTKRGFEIVRKDLARITNEQAKDVGNNVGGMVNVVGSALKTLGENTNKALKAFGAKSISFSVDSVGKAASNVLGKQRGGPINTGAASGDSVPAMLERGEYVLNRNAVSAMGKGNLDAINFGAAKRFATGGMVDPAGPGTGVVNQAIAGIVGAWSQKYNAAINYGYDPGGGHKSPGHNVTGTATDTGPAAGWGAGPTALFESGLRAILGKVPQILYGSHGIGTPYDNHGWGNHAHIEWGMNPNIKGFAEAVALKKLALQGPDGPLKSMGQGALNMAYKAANAFIGKQAPSPIMGDVGALGGKGSYTKPEIASLWKKVNPGIGNPNLMAAIAMAESTGNPNALNSIGAKGLWQIIPSTASAFGLNYGNLFNPAYNAMGAGKILQGQGLGAWEAYTLGMHQQYLQKGGMPSLDTGGRVTRTGLAEVHPGDVHVGKGPPQVHISFGNGMEWLREFVNVEIDGATPEIIEETSRQLGRSVSRSRQLA